MPCYHPVRVNIKRKSTVSRAGIRDSLPVGCGHCLGCRADKARQWAIRLTHESLVNTPSFFLTLTYAPENLPENGSLEPDHLTKFWKDLRNHLYLSALEKYPDLTAKEVRQRTRRFSYYACGEYGALLRPHYHAVTAGLPFPDRAHHRDDDSGTVFRSSLLEHFWPYGLSELTGVSFASAAYVAGYVYKKQSGKHAEENAYTRVDPKDGELIDVEPEFARMSRRPAIGLDWLKKYWSDVYPRDVVVLDGHESKPPRYYDRVFTDPSAADERVPKHVLPGITYPERLEMMYDVKMKRLEEFEEHPPEVLASMKKNHEARMKLFTQRNKL